MDKTIRDFDRVLGSKFHSRIQQVLGTVFRTNLLFIIAIERKRKVHYARLGNK